MAGLVENTRVRTTEVLHRGELLSEVLKNYLGANILEYGAKCDGVTDDADAIDAAVIAGKGSIIIPGPCFVSRTIYIRDYDNPTVTFLGNGSISIDQDFQFRAGTRGILCFHLCRHPKVKDPIITGARVFHPTAPEPWQDGDAGVEYLVCSGWCGTFGGRLSNFMTWGVIHTQSPMYCLAGTDIDLCMVQSGVGGIDVKVAIIRDVSISRVGLYGVEVESRNAIETVHIQNALITDSQKGVMCYDSVLQPSINGVTVKRCMEGVSFTNNAPNNGEGGSVTGCNMIDCRTSMLSNNVNKTRWVGNTARRFTDEVYTRTRAQDFIRKVQDSTAYMVNEASALANLNVGDRVKLEDDVERTVTAVNTGIVDPVFGACISFQTNPAMTSTALHNPVRRPMTPGYAGMVMYGGLANTVQNNAFGYQTIALLSYGAHSQLLWNGNTYENVGTILANGQDGAITDSKISVRGEECTGNSLVANHPKFAPAYAVCTEHWLGGVAPGHAHVLAMGDGYIGKIVCILDPSVGATGTIVLKVNGVDTIVGFSGDPAVGVANVNVRVQGSLRLQLVDTAGDIHGYGFSVKLYGSFTSD